MKRSEWMGFGGYWLATSSRDALADGLTTIVFFLMLCSSAKSTTAAASKQGESASQAPPSAKRPQAAAAASQFSRSAALPPKKMMKMEELIGQEVVCEQCNGLGPQWLGQLWGIYTRVCYGKQDGQSKAAPSHPLHITHTPPLFI